tara:strand:- start:304 stop:534 length:231 start_codon:yes stop_codon:yes gene_type:complete
MIKEKFKNLKMIQKMAINKLAEKYSDEELGHWNMDLVILKNLEESRNFLWWISDKKLPTNNQLKAKAKELHSYWSE